MNERLERAVAMSADFLRETREDLRYAAIMASNDDQRRRAENLSHAASKAKELAGELVSAWVAARKSEPKATKLVGATLMRTPGPHRPPASIPPFEQVEDVPRSIGGSTAVPRGGEQVTIHRGTTALQMPAATPPEVVDVLFSIAAPLGLASDTVWPIESLPREVRELASDAAHNDETARATVSIQDVCRALGISAWVRERVLVSTVSRPATREEIITKLEGIRGAMQVSLQASVGATRAIAGQLEVVEGGLVQRLAEHIAEVDPAWFEALLEESS